MSGDVDEYGDEVETEETEAAVCELQQRRRDEPGAEGEFSDTDWAVYLPSGTEIDTGDAVVVDGQVYEVVGDPWPARNPRTEQASHIEASVRRTAGEGAAS